MHGNARSAENEQQNRDEHNVGGVPGGPEDSGRVSEPHQELSLSLCHVIFIMTSLACMYKLLTFIFWTFYLLAKSQNFIKMLGLFTNVK